MRSFNRRMPEEVNRVLADHASTWLMSPTDTATANLRHEDIPAEQIHQVGDVMYDAALFYGNKAEQHSHILAEHGRAYVLATIHRQENTDAPDRLRAIFQALQAVARELPVVLPLHPRTRQRLADADALSLAEGLTLMPPVGYLDMVMLERGAAVVVTDSGGVQKEAYFHGVSCVTLRDETEWVELVDLGWNRLAPPGQADMAAAIRGAIGEQGTTGTPYGDGQAAVRVVQIVA